MGVFKNLRLGAYKIFTIFSHTFSVSLFSIKKTKKKEHCFNFIPIIYDFFGGAGGGEGGSRLLGAGRLLTFLAVRVARLFEVGACLKLCAYLNNSYNVNVVY